MTYHAFDILTRMAIDMFTDYVYTCVTDNFLMHNIKMVKDEHSFYCCGSALWKYHQFDNNLDQVSDSKDLHVNFL